MSHLAIFALGPLRIELDGKLLQTSRHKAMALLLYLAMQPGNHSREALSALLWPDYGQEKAFAYLRRTLWEIRVMLGEGWLDANRTEIGFTPKASVFLDVSILRSHLKAFQQHTHLPSSPCQECITHLHNAALLYRGDFISEFNLRDSANFEDWQFFQQDAIRREYADVLKKMTNLLYSVGGFTDAIVFSRRWLALDTYNEEAHRVLMKLYTVTGQRHLALRQYQECVRILQTELNATPEPMTSALNEVITSNTFEPGEEFPTLRSMNSQQGFSEKWTEVSLGVKVTSETTLFGNLPIPLTPIIGRRQAVNDISSLLSAPDCWLLTLLGPGGIGKTRLGVEVGRELIPHFPQGVFFVPLSMIEQERSIVPAIARSVGLSFRQNGPAPEEQLFDFLREKHLLLILDSFEQLIQWARLLEQIHFHAPGIKMMVTSRHRLLLQAECVIEVKGLEYPLDSPQLEEMIQDDVIHTCSAVDLFLSAARRVRVTFQPSPEDYSAIVCIAQLLEGMPLGLELAATWVHTLSCQEIATEINRGLDILETSQGDITERQRSMRAVFGHSWNLLSRREQTILPRLAVFRGSFSRQAAEQIAGISFRELAGLVDKSLVRRSSDGRFDMHDLLRQYYLEILGRLPGNVQETRSRHCAFYCSRLSKWNEQLSSVKQGAALAQIEVDLENIETAWEWAVSHKQFGHLEQAVDGLGMFYLRRARLGEGFGIYKSASESLKGFPATEVEVALDRLSARLLIWQATFSMNLERFDQADQLLQEGDLILDNPELDQHQIIPERVFGLIIHALLANLQHDPAATLCFYRRAIELSKKVKLKTPRFFVYFWRFMMGGSVSRELYLEIEKNLEYVERSGDAFELGYYLYILGIAELYHYYRIEKAQSLLEACIQNFERVEDPSTRLMVIKTKTYLLLVQGRFDECYALKQQEIKIVQNIGDRRLIGITHCEIGEVLCHLGHYREAEDQIRIGMALVKDRSEVEYALRHRYLGDVLLAQGKYAEAREAYGFSFRFFESVDEKGWMLTALTGLSLVEYALGNRSGAWQYALKALQFYSEIQLYTFFVFLTVGVVSLLLADRGAVVRAQELYRLVSQQGYLGQSRWFFDIIGKRVGDAPATLTLAE